jgi:hypothetical protein
MRVLSLVRDLLCRRTDVGEFGVYDLPVGFELGEIACNISLPLDPR